MTDDLVKRAREALDGVTEGPWVYESTVYSDWGDVYVNGFRLCQARDPRATDDDTLSMHRKNGTDPWAANARFIAASRDLVPEMTDRIEALEAKLAKLEDSLVIYRLERVDLAEITGGKTDD